ncbi:MAG: DUF4007 family protein [Candidatus Rifleibacteriota bacterium]
MPRIQKKSINNTQISFKFSGHETFACRYAWLTKAAQAVSGDPTILTPKCEDDAMTTLGVGKNMVKSIRYWAEAAGIIQDLGSCHSVTTFGQELLLGSCSPKSEIHPPFDPYLEDIQTLWLIHWKLANKRSSPIFVWDFLLNRFNEPELSTSTVVKAMEKELSQYQISRSSVEQLWDVFLRSYVPSKSQKAEVREDNLDCPLVELNLLLPTGITESTINHGRIESKYAFRREEKPEIGQELFAYFLCEFWEGRHSEEQSIPLHIIANGHGSPGQVLKIPEPDIRSRLLKIEKSSFGYFFFEESAAIPRVIRRDKVGAPSLKNVYDVEAKLNG